MASQRAYHVWFGILVGQLVPVIRVHKVAPDDKRLPRPKFEHHLETFVLLATLPERQCFLRLTKKVCVWEGGALADIRNRNKKLISDLTGGGNRIEIVISVSG